MEYEKKEKIRMVYTLGKMVKEGQCHLNSR